MTLKNIYITTVEVAMIFSTIESLQILILKIFFKYDSTKDDKEELKKSFYDCPIKFNEKIIQYTLDKKTIAIILGSILTMIVMLLPIINIVFSFEAIKSMKTRYSKARK